MERLDSASQATRILICIPQTRGSYDREFVESYIRAKNWLLSHADQVPFEFVIVEYFCHTFPIDANRNECAALALKNNIDLTIWFDTDQDFPDDVLIKLINHSQEHQIVAGIYHAKNPPYHPIIFRESPNSKDFDLFNAVIDFPDDELFYADMIGMGCVAIRTEVFRRMGMPYFKYQAHPRQLAEKDYISKMKVEYGIADVSEDVWFCKKAKECGYRIVIDPTIDVAHYGRYRVSRDIWKRFVETQKELYAAQNGAEALKEKEAEECRPELLKSAS